MILYYLPLVQSLAKRFANRGEPIEDLVQQGTLGLISAIDRFDVKRGVRFTTYAIPTILGEIKRYFRDKGWGLRIPRRLQEINQQVLKAVEDLTRELERSPTIPEIAQAVGCTEDETLEALEMAQSHGIVSLDSVEAEREGQPTYLVDRLGAEDAGLEAVGLRAQIQEALKRLPARERKALQMGFFGGYSQSEIARVLGVSQVHVSRILRRVLSQMRRSMAS